MLLFLAAFTVGRSAIETIRAGSEQSAGKPGLIALVAAIVSIVVKEALFHYTMHQARILDSEALRADAWHNRSDSLSSIGALVGIAGARMGLPVLDPIAGLVICVFILKAGIDVFRESIEKLTDHRCDPMLEKQIRDCVACFDEVKNIDVLRTREFGRRVYIDMELSMPGQHTLAATHQTAEEIHDKLETDFPKIKHVMIHVNPC